MPQPSNEQMEAAAGCNAEYKRKDQTLPKRGWDAKGGGRLLITNPQCG